MRGDGRARTVSGIPSVWLILNTRSLHSIRVLPKPRRFWAEPNQVFAQSKDRLSMHSSRWPPKDSFLNRRGLCVCVCVRALCKHRKLLMHEVHCRMFPKHCETYASNIDGSSGTVYLEAAGHRIQLSSNNLTCHFMVWCFCEMCKRPSAADTDEMF